MAEEALGITEDEAIERLIKGVPQADESPFDEKTKPPVKDTKKNVKASVEDEGPESEEVPEVDQEAEETSDDTDQVEIDITALSKVLGVDEDAIVVDEKGLRIRDGEAELDFKTMKEAYSDHAKSKTLAAELEDRYKLYHEDLEATKALFTEKAHAMGALNNHLQSQLNKDIEKIDWAHLREYDPSEFMIKKIEMQERQQEINHLQEAIQSEFEATQQALKEKEDTFTQQKIEQELKILSKKLPEFSNDKYREGLQSYMQTIGYTKEQVDNIRDHQQFVMAAKAMKYDEMMSKSNMNKKKLVNLPKVLKPSAGQPDKSGTYKKHIQNLRKTGDSDYAVEAYLAMQK